ncbi:MAG: TatD family hydrolase [Chitinispirillia bacterium]|nr:TatD family hydrolase [Chitinispirillia bacterium]
MKYRALIFMGALLFGRFSMFDSHCHLQDKRIYTHLSCVLEKARLVGVNFMLCCGIREDDWADVAAIGSYRSSVVCAFGIHPWYADSVSSNWDTALEKYLTDNPNAAVGEIGLHYNADRCNDDQQKRVFIRQLDIAQTMKRPVSIHCYKAWGDLIPLLKKRGGLSYGGAIHSYSGPPDLVKQLEDLGCYISFSGSILNKNAKRSHQSLKLVSPDKLLAETDSPDMLPYQCEADFNEPSNLPIIIKKMAEILGESEGNIAALTGDNGRRLFFV